MAWRRNHLNFAAKCAFEIRLLVADCGTAQAQGHLPEVEARNSGGKPVGETNGRQERAPPCAAAGVLNIGVAATDNSLAQTRSDFAGVQAVSSGAKPPGEITAGDE